jgi:hypothetical protein
MPPAHFMLNPELDKQNGFLEKFWLLYLCFNKKGIIYE